MRKKSIAVLLSILLGTIPVQAAEWGEGLGPERPYPNVKSVDLNETMGYMMFFPRDKMPAEHYCDVLEMYYPREDVARGKGKINLFDEEGQLYSADIEDTDAVTIRPLEVFELDALHWGSGTCVSVHLPVSLDLDGKYYVGVDEGILTAADGKVSSPAIGLTEDGGYAWEPILEGPYGVGGLCYREGTDADTASADGSSTDTASTDASSETEGAEAASTGDASTTAEAGTDTGELVEEGEVTTSPKAGDTVSFDITLGGDAVTAVLFCENGSVKFPALEYKQSGRVIGQVMDSHLIWGVIFLNTDGDILDVVYMNV